MKKNLILFFILFGKLMVAQSSLGVDVEFNNDLYSIDKDAGGKLKKAPVTNISPGLYYRYLFKNNLFVQTGLRFKEFYCVKASVVMPSGEDITRLSSVNMALQIPFSLGKRFKLFGSERFFVSPFVGATLNIFLEEKTITNSGVGKFKTTQDSLFFQSVIQYPQKNYFTLSVGTSVEYQFRFISTALFFQWNQGFSPIMNQTVVYWLNQNPSNTATQTYRGTYYTFFGLRLFRHF